MPCVISRRSPGLVFVVFVTKESNIGQCLFTLDDAFFPATHGGKRFLDCVWVRLLPMGPRDHVQERSHLMRFLYCPWAREKPWRYGEAAVRRAKSLHTKEDNIMLVVNGWIPWLVYVVMWYICDKLLYVRFYGFGIILLVLTDYNI